MAFSFKAWFNKWLDDGATTRLDDGSLLRASGAYAYYYIENDHQVTVQYERLSGKPDTLIYTSTLDYWNSPHDDEPISEAKKAEILKKVCNLFDKRGHTYRIKYHD